VTSLLFTIKVYLKYGKFTFVTKKTMDIEACKSGHMEKGFRYGYFVSELIPFLDGNGRIGRLLITLYLVSKKGLTGLLFFLDFASFYV
jgi:fido (protein-threonine AMPylation protein)